MRPAEAAPGGARRAAGRCCAWGRLQPAAARSPLPSICAVHDGAVGCPARWLGDWSRRLPPQGRSPAALWPVQSVRRGHSGTWVSPRHRPAAQVGCRRSSHRRRRHRHYTAQLPHASSCPHRLADPAFAPWEDALALLPKYAVAAGRGELRAWLAALPPFPTNALLAGSGSSCEGSPAGSAELWRAYLLLSFLAHGYMWCDGPAPPPALPARLAAPWVAVAGALGMPPVLVYATYNLLNWQRLDAEQPVVLGNIACLNNFLGGVGGFFLGACVAVRDLHWCGAGQDPWQAGVVTDTCLLLLCLCRPWPHSIQMRSGSAWCMSKLSSRQQQPWRACPPPRRRPRQATPPACDWRWSGPLRR